MTAGECSISPASAGEVRVLAGLMADSPLLARYRVAYDAALASLEDAQAGGDALLVARVPDASTGIVLIVGFAWVAFAPRVLGGAAYLRLLLVAHGRQGHGLGARLLEAAEQVAAERANHLYLLTTTDNHGARRFYVRHGYRHVGDLPGLVWPDLDEALYHKPLHPRGA